MQQFPIESSSCSRLLQHLQLGLSVLSQHTLRPLLHPQTPPCHEQHPDCIASSALAKVRPLHFAGSSTFKGCSKMGRGGGVPTEPAAKKTTAAISKSIDDLQK